MLLQFIVLALFGMAMAHVEGVVVVYLRKAIGLLDPKVDNRQALDQVPRRYVQIEMTREAATIVMLVSLAWLMGENLLHQIMVFLWTFAFWDLFYYVSLYLLIGWPPKLTTTDVLFLIPRPWIAPVWFPLGVSSLTIILIFLLYLLPYC
ncbi:hypothetical protein [Sunxiuqinia elliptica]|uniref:Uncharacterized protein n=1 Tax=Sunxiuqinia elliptica TaxID=655355 RepID=A0A4R6HB84_9BACT|nr:hypothetical protein [Sunxiuqinia elliptica]TDO05650.1 hypothetical protein DET52_1011014 [Sunxiuqinia elliptica]TDO65194.1 hypothetical protein DET65_1572 [Sunxiuqinia elliptica]